MLGNIIWWSKSTKFPMYVETIMDDSIYCNFEGNEGCCFDVSEKYIEPVPITDDFLKDNEFMTNKTFIISTTTDNTTLTTAIFTRDIDGRQITLVRDGNCKTDSDINDKDKKNYALFVNKKNGERNYITSIEYIHELQNILNILFDINIKIKI